MKWPYVSRREHERVKRELQDWMLAACEVIARAELKESTFVWPTLERLERAARRIGALERQQTAHAETTAALAAYKVRCERLTALLRQEYDGNEDALCAIHEAAEEMEDASDELKRLARLLKGVRNSFASSDDVAAAIGEADQ